MRSVLLYKPYMFIYLFEKESLQKCVFKKEQKKKEQRERQKTNLSQ